MKFLKNSPVIWICDFLKNSEDISFTEIYQLFLLAKNLFTDWYSDQNSWKFLKNKLKFYKFSISGFGPKPLSDLFTLEAIHKRRRPIFLILWPLPPPHCAVLLIDDFDLEIGFDIWLLETAQFCLIFITKGWLVFA